ncbi:MAG: hypothetical protein JW850_02880 [Thermoflexales bacterium]|nr:hypothetical protein [Thermoflexales bacterium]
MTKRASRVLIIVLVCLALFVLYLLSGMSGREARVEYTVDVRDPASGIVHVNMVMHPPSRPFVTLWLRDTNHRGLHRVEHFSVRRGSQLLPNWQTLPGFADARSVWTGFSQKAVEIDYDVNPYWMKGQAPRSYLGPDFGYLRGMVVLYTPLTLKSISGMLNYIDVLDDSAGRARLQFFLPDEWTLISPWGSGELETPVAHIRNTYFGLGPMSVTTTQVGDSALLLGVYAELNEEQLDYGLQDIPHLFETMGELTGVSLHSATPYWALTVFSDEPIHGGASGTNSLVTSDDLPTISHEMFHWWNGRTVESTPDANWIEEGFTEYYEGKALYSAGIWSSDELSEHLDKLYGRRDLEFVGIDGQWLPINLVQASENLVRKGANEEYCKVYNGGALIAYFLDQRLQMQGKSLDEIWRLLNDVNEPISTDVFLQELEILGGVGLARECEDLVHGRRAIPHP